MPYRVNISAHAEADLSNIFHYITFSLCAPQNAKAQLIRLKERILHLAELPTRYRIYPKKFAEHAQVRAMPVDNFTVFYTVNEMQKSVIILRVIYGGRDIDRAFSN